MIALRFERFEGSRTNHESERLRWSLHSFCLLTSRGTRFIRCLYLAGTCWHTCARMREVKGEDFLRRSLVVLEPIPRRPDETRRARLVRCFATHLLRADISAAMICLSVWDNTRPAMGKIRSS